MILFPFPIIPQGLDGVLHRLETTIETNNKKREGGSVEEEEEDEDEDEDDGEEW